MFLSQANGSANRAAGRPLWRVETPSGEERGPARYLRLTCWCGFVLMLALVAMLFTGSGADAKRLQPRVPITPSASALTLAPPLPGAERVCPEPAGSAPCYLLIDPDTVTVGNGPSTVDGTYVNAQDIADNLVFTSITLQASDSITVADNVDLSQSAYGIPAFHLSLDAPTLNLDNNMVFNTFASLTLNADTMNLSGRITVGGTLINPARVTGTALQVNVLGNTASIQQGMDSSSSTAPVTVHVSPGQYTENLAIRKPLTLSGNDGTTTGADPAAPELFGTHASGNLITVSSDNVTIDGLQLSGAVAGGSLAAGVNGVYANAVSNLSVIHNTFEGFSGPDIVTPGSSNVTLNANLFADDRTVTFDANGGSGSIADETHKAPTALTANSFTRAGYTFSGWNTAADGSGTDYADGASYPFDADATLYAQWFAPDTEISSGPSGVTNSNDPSFEFAATAANPGGKLRCRLDGPGATTGSYADCDSPKSYTDLADGDYSFSVVAVDAAGNEDLTAASRQFTVDTQSPDTEISSGPSGATNSNDPTFQFAATAANPGGKLRCRLDGPGATTGSYADCDSPKSYTDLADGDYSFRAVAVDAAGNEDGSPATRSFTIDTTPAHTPAEPTVSIVSPAERATFVAGRRLVASYSCAADRTLTVASCVGPVPSGEPIDTSAAGDKEFKVTATDSAGNQASKTVHYTVVATTPGPRSHLLVRHPNKLVKRNRTAIGLSCVGLGSQRCQGSVRVQATNGTGRLRGAATRPSKFNLAPGEQKSLRVPLPRATLARLAKKHKAVARVVARLTDGTSVRRLISLKV
jgi:hypothetical protein